MFLDFINSKHQLMNHQVVQEFIFIYGLATTYQLDTTHIGKQESYVVPDLTGQPVDMVDPIV